MNRTLALDELEPGDVALDLAVGPRQGESRCDGALIVSEPTGELGQWSGRRVGEPGVEAGRLPLPDHRLEPFEKVTCGDEDGTAASTITTVIASSPERWTHVENGCLGSGRSVRSGGSGSRWRIPDLPVRRILPGGPA
jgi:hypothetical protein